MNKLNLLFLFLLLFAFQLDAQNRHKGETTNLEQLQHLQTEPCLHDHQRQLIQQKLNFTIKELGLRLESGTEEHQLVSFIWPVKKAAHSTAHHIYGISNYVDHNETAPGELQDYNCGMRTYDLPSGYNHRGTDIYLWPFSWNMMANDEGEVVAAAEGIIIGKDDGNFDRNCNFDDPNWNAVYLMHIDGSTTWYGHLKENTLTQKQIGETVEQGEYLGIIGSSGSSTGPHLHFEVYNSMGQLVDPYFDSGGCNAFNNESWWQDQKDYHDSKLNAVHIHSAPPQFNSCPDTSDRNLQSVFHKLDTVFLAMYYTDHLAGQNSDFKITDPEGMTYDQWFHAPNAPYYSSSYYYWWLIFPQTAKTGTYEFEVIFMNDTVVQQFQITDACSISNLTYSNIECTTDSTYLVTVDFDYQNVTNDFFDLSDRNGILDFFAYDSLPIRLEVPISGLDYELLKVSDNDNPNCSTAVEFMVDCDTLANECMISGLEASNRACSSDSTYWATIDFEYSNVPSDSFQLSNRSEIIGTFSYADLPIRIELQLTQETYQLLSVNDILDQSCSDVIEFFEHCNCWFYIHYFNAQCTSDSTYLISINVTRQNIFGDSFRVEGVDTTYGSYSYDSLPIRLEAKIIDGDYQLLTIRDLRDTSCYTPLEFMVDCNSTDSCDIVNLTLSDIECASDSSYFVTVNFDYENIPDQYLILNNPNGFVTGIHIDSIPIRIEIPVSGNNSEFIEISDAWRLTCSTKEEFVIDCNDLDSCQFSDLEFSNFECTSDSTYLATIDFDYQNVTNDFFDLSDRHHILGTFPYDSIPIRIEVPISGLDYEFLKVSDNDNPHCSAANEFMVNCSTHCEISNLTFSHIECTSDSTYLVTIDFDYQNVTNNFFDLSDRHHILGTFPYDSIPIRIEVPISGFDYEFLKVSDNDNPHCSAADEFALGCTSNQSTGFDPTHFKVWPNPVQDLLFIRSELTIEFTLYNSAGNLMMNGELKVDTPINMGNLPAGIYFLHLQSENLQDHHKIIKM